MKAEIVWFDRWATSLGAGTLAAALVAGNALAQEAPPPSPSPAPATAPRTQPAQPPASQADADSARETAKALRESQKNREAVKAEQPADAAAPRTDAPRARAPRADAPRADAPRATPANPRVPATGEVREAREGVREARQDLREARQDRREERRETREETREVRAENVRPADLGIWFQRGSRDGLVIADVAAEGAIAKVGFREGDRIVSVHGRPVTTEAQFVQLLFAPSVRQERIEVIVIRDGREQVVFVEPAVLIQEVVTYDPLYRYGLVIDDRSPDRIVVLRVFPRTPAYYAGLRAGDVIVSLGGRPIARQVDLVRAFERADSNLALQVSRGQQTRELEIDVADAQGFGEARTTLRPNLDDARLDGRGEGRLEGRTEGRLEGRSEARPRLEGRSETPSETPSTLPRINRPMTDSPSATPRSSDAPRSPATPSPATPSSPATPKAKAPTSPSPSSPSPSSPSPSSPSPAPRAETPSAPAAPATGDSPRQP